MKTCKKCGKTKLIQKGAKENGLYTVLGDTIANYAE
jgi:hypothetical protein